ncbi:MAG: hypothetical protein ACYC54_00360 [Sedimentisphaerales bacterium]
MDQKQRHELALKALDNQCTEAFVMLSLCLDRDRFQRQRCIPQDVMRYIHNEALFGCLRTVNSTASLKSIKEYLRFADTLKPKFFEIVEAIRNFQPTGTIAEK